MYVYDTQHKNIFTRSYYQILSNKGSDNYMRKLSLNIPDALV